jgi:hypothetical protein
MLLVYSREFLWKERRSGYARPQEPPALEIAAEQMRIWPIIGQGNYIPLYLCQNKCVV